MFKIDLHTHSTASPDGSIRPEQYRQIIESGLINYIAVTDHNRIDMAQELHHELGDSIIVGEEINTTSGEIIGLFLKKAIEPNLSLQEAIRAIKAQKGIVYVPHPFETVRSGVPIEALDDVAEDVDIVEVHNGRTVFQNRGPQAAVWAKLHHKRRAASSDAHGLKGIGKTYTTVSEKPSAKTLLVRLDGAHLTVAHPPLTTLLYPKINRLRRGLHR